MAHLAYIPTYNEYLLYTWVISFKYTNYFSSELAIISLFTLIIKLSVVFFNIYNIVAKFPEKFSKILLPLFHEHFLSYNLHLLQRHCWEIGIFFKVYLIVSVSEIFLNIFLIIYNQIGMIITIYLLESWKFYSNI